MTSFIKKHKLIIGSVQFGLKYGIANTQGQVTPNEAKKILKNAHDSGINTLDTAINYGNSSQVLGSLSTSSWRIITKLSEIPEHCDCIKTWIKQQINSTLKDLKRKKIDALLLHNPNQLLEQKGELIWQVLQTLKDNGTVDKIGFSIYSPTQLDSLLPQFMPDLIQAPYNIFDQRLKQSGWLKRLNKLTIEVHIRSIFLQGLLLMPAKKRPSFFNQWPIIWQQWDNYLVINKLSPLEACINFVTQDSDIQHIVIGIDSNQQLSQILHCNPLINLQNPEKLSCLDEQLINPSKWSPL